MTTPRIANRAKEKKFVMDKISVPASDVIPVLLACSQSKFEISRLIAIGDLMGKSDMADNFCDSD